MDRFIRLVLLVGLLVSSLGAIAYAVRILVGQVVPVRWYWAGALTAFCGPIAFALAAYLNELRLRIAPAHQVARNRDA